MIQSMRYDERTTSGMTSRVVLCHVEREAGPAGVADLLRRAGAEGLEDRLRDEGQWLSWDLKLRLFEAACAVTGDEHVMRRVGATSLTMDVAPGVKLAARALGSPRLLLANADRLAGKFCTTHRFEVVRVGAQEAVLRHRDVSGVGYDRRDCDYNIGFLTAAPELFGLPAARVEHTACGVDGAPACEYRVRWSALWTSARIQAAVGAATLGGAAAASLAGRRGLPVTAGVLTAGATTVARRVARAERERLRRLRGQLDEQRSGAERSAAALRSLSEARSVDDVVHRIGHDGQSAVGGRDYALLLEDEVGALRCRAASGVSPQAQDALSAWAATCELPADRAVVLDHPAASRPELAAVEQPTLCAAPLRFADRTIGVLVALGPTPASFGGYDAQLLFDYAAQAGIALANARLVERLEALATRDPLTGLLNEQGFGAAVERELRRSGSVLAVAILRLADFAGVARDHGREAADDLLRRTGRALADVGGVAFEAEGARLSASTFALLVRAHDGGRAVAAVDEARAAVAAAAGIDCSAGVALAPSQADDMPGLLERAGAALASTASDTSETRLFDALRSPTARAEAERGEVEAVLADPDRLTVNFQPIVDVRTGRVSGYEALSRFTGEPQRTPDVWFAMAHRAGLGPELEALALAQALAIADRPAGTVLNLNASPAALASDVLWDVLPDDLTDIVIEITEHDVFGAGDELERSIARIRARGGRVALDDAGSGWSGLQQLIRVGPDIVKLDRSLISGLHERPAGRSLVEALVRFAASTQSTVCAEGVEEAAEQAVLEAIGVDYAQGWLHGRPAPPWPQSAPAAPAALAA